MPKKEKPLPKPPKTPFERKKPFDGEGKQEPLMADRMAVSMSEGKLEEFMQRELPDNEHARKLAEMMMGMTGMLTPAGFSGKPEPKKEGPSEKPEASIPEKQSSEVHPPDDVVNAVKSADVKGLMDLLRREHNKRHGDEGMAVAGEKHEYAHSPDQAMIEKEIIERLISIASDNNLSLDWIFFRALKRYVQEYEKTGNL